MIDLRFTGTLQFDRADLSIDELSEQTKTALDALYVQTNTSEVTTAEIQALLDEIDDEEIFVDGRLQTEVLEHRVFETIATESRYSDHADEVATLLGTAHQMAQKGEAVADIRETISDRRRELFPDLTADVTVDVELDPFATTDEDEDQATKRTDADHETTVSPNADSDGGFDQ